MLITAMEPFFHFHERRSGADAVLHGTSLDARVLLELVEDRQSLRAANITLALSDRNELEQIKAGCWTLVFLKALFPDWSDVQTWIHDSAGHLGCAEPHRTKLLSHSVSCHYNPEANVIEYRLERLPR